jgi:hypothetical protein
LCNLFLKKLARILDKIVTAFLGETKPTHPTECKTLEIAIEQVVCGCSREDSINRAIFRILYRFQFEITLVRTFTLRENPLLPYEETRYFYLDRVLFIRL